MKTLTLSSLIIVTASILFAGSIVAALYTANANIATIGCLTFALFGSIAYAQNNNK